MVSSKDKLNANQRRVADQRIVKNVGIKEFKVYSDTEKIKVRVRESVAADAPNTGRKPIVRTRKSIPVMEGGKGGDLGDLKGSAENESKSKRMQHSSVKVKVGRKILADISNVRNSLTKNGEIDGSKPLKIHDGKKIKESRVSIVRKTASASSLARKSIMGKARSQCPENHPILQKYDAKDFKVYSDQRKKNIQNHESFSTDDGATARRPPILTRKSLPVIKRTNQINSNYVKGIHETKVGKKVVPNVSNSRSYVRRNRASDVIVSMKSINEKTSLLDRVPVEQNTANVCAMSRKLVRPTGNTLTVFKAQMTSTSKCTLSLKKPTSDSANLSRNKEEITKIAAPKKAQLVVSHKSTPGNLPSSRSSLSNMTTTCIISRSRSSRRKSFTSMVLGKCVEVNKHLELPNIDDNTNPLEVAEYVDDIYHYYWVMEAQYPSLVNYMEKQTEITPRMRGILINWLIEVHYKFGLMQETLFLMVALLDRFLSVYIIKKKEMQLVSLTSLLLASKYEDFWHPKVKDLISISADSYTRNEMLAMESLILKKLMFRLNVPTPYVFMLRFLKAAQSEMKLEHLAFYLIELSLVEYEALKFKPSLLCASAIYVARCTLQIAPAWTTLLSRHTHYEESELRECADMILKFQKAAARGPLKVTYEKYLHPDQSCVAAIEAIDRLPQ
ncbi:PREDICTED: putative cyclin-B3-1 [Nelumbo nucifera]|uniref:Cyclin-B3-1 n=2 Tax=Nelumbo nucifera TaxID=4432 RepID=A0A822ZHN5_NELNU|nr:PREDICTED: putative cyclin-B3-1 [Nelumbo nucifera]DAD44030.1 TPA_asm: hypothetical protein HUJ06_002260 [Nelumbo nucifera]